MPTSHPSDAASEYHRAPSESGGGGILPLMELGLLILGCWAYWPTLRKIFETWDSNPDYSHGFLIVPIALGFLWVRRDKRPPGNARFNWAGLILLAMAGLLRFTAGRFYLPELDGWSIPLWLGGIVLLFHGRGFFRWALPSLAFLWFATPLPASFEVLLSTPLQLFAAHLASWTLRLVGQPAIAEGTTILLNDSVLDVEQACSGLRMLYGILALGVACVILANLRGWAAGIVLLATVPIALFANVCRIVATGWLLQKFSGEVADKFSHDMAGYFMIPLAVVLLGLLWLWLERGSQRFRADRADGIRWLLHWTVGVIVLVGGLLGWGNHQQKHAYRALLDAANRYESRQEWRQAAQSLQQYLRANPNDPEVLAHFAELTAKTATSPSEKRRAIRYALVAWRKQPARADLALYAARTMLEQGDPLNAAKTCEELLATDHLATQREAVTLLRADALLVYLNNDISATDYSWQVVANALEATQEFDTGELHYAIELARIWQEKLAEPNQKIRAEYAREIIDRLVIENAENPMAWLARYEFLYDFSNPGDKQSLQLADQDLSRALDRIDQAKPEEQAVIFLAAAAQAQEAKNGAAAERYLRQAMAASPENPLPYIGLAEIERHAGGEAGQKKAREILQAGLETVGERDLYLLLPLASLQVESEAWEAAEQTIAAVESQIQVLDSQQKTRVKLGASLIRARIIRHRDGVYSAIRNIETLLDDEQVRDRRQLMPELYAQAHVLLGELYRAVDIYDRASEQYRFALQLIPESKSVRLEAAVSALQAGDLESAALHYRQLLKINPDSSDAWLALLEIEIRRQSRQPAESRDWSEAEREYAQALKRDIPSADLLLVHVELLEAQERYDQAEQLLLEATEQAPDEPLLWRELALLFDRRGQAERAQEAAENYLRLEPTSIEPNAIKATLLEKANRSEQAQAVLSDLMNRSQGRRWVLAAQEFSRLQLLLGNIDEAQELLEDIHQREPTDITVISTLANLAWVSGNMKQLETYESWLREIGGEAGSLWRFHRAQRLLSLAVSTEDANFEETRKLTQALQDLRPRWSKTSLLQADLALRAGLIDRAISAYQRAWELGDRSALVADRLIELLTNQGRFSEAKSYVTQVRGALPLSSRLLDRSMPYFAQAGELTEALRLAQAWVVRRPNDATSAMRLGRVLMMLSKEAGDEQADYLDRAKRAFQQAMRLAPTDVNVWVANVMLAEQQSQGEVELDQIVEQLRENVTLDEFSYCFMLAQLYEVLDQPLKAHHQYTRAVELMDEEMKAETRSEAYGKVAQFYLQRIPMLAEHYARRALQLDAKAAMAEQALFQVLAENESALAVEEALVMADHFQQDGYSGNEDQVRRVRAELLARRGEPGDLEQAIELLETTLLQTREDMRLLASLYERSERIGPAFDLLRELADSKTARPQDQIAFLKFWQQHFYQPPGKRESSQFSSLAARVYAELLKTPQLQPEWLRWKLRERVQSHSAETLDWNHVQRLVQQIQEANSGFADWSRGKKIAWCRSLLRVFLQEGQPLLAMQWVETPTAEVEQTDAAIAMCLALILSPVSTDFQREANQLLQALQAKNPQQGDLMRAVADYQLMTGQYELATAAYRASLEIDPTHMLARNNLALALAEQASGLVEAREIIHRALEDSPADPVLLDTRAVLDLIDHRPQAALQALEQVVAAEPENAMARIHTAMAYQALGDKKMLREALLDALVLGIDSAMLSPRDREFMQSVSGDELDQLPAEENSSQAQSLSNEKRAVARTSIR